MICRRGLNGPTDTRGTDDYQVNAEGTEGGVPVYLHQVSLWKQKKERCKDEEEKRAKTKGRKIIKRRQELRPEEKMKSGKGKTERQRSY